MQETIDVNLTETNWDGARHAWRCPALTIPGAELVGLFLDGEVPRSEYDIRDIVWITPHNGSALSHATAADSGPVGVVASIALRKDIVTRETQTRVAVIGVVGSVLVAIIAGVAGYLTAKPHDLPTAHASTDSHQSAAAAAGPPPSGHCDIRDQRLNPLRAAMHNFDACLGLANQGDCRAPARDVRQQCQSLIDELTDR